MKSRIEKYEEQLPMTKVPLAKWIEIIGEEVELVTFCTKLGPLLGKDDLG